MVCTSFPFTVRMSQQDVVDTERTGIFLPLLPSSIPGKAAAQSSPNFTHSSKLNECNAPARLLKMHPVLQQLCTQFHICTSQARTSLWFPERSSVFQAVCFKMWLRKLILCESGAGYVWAAKICTGHTWNSPTTSWILTWLKLTGSDDSCGMSGR